MSEAAAELGAFLKRERERRTIRGKPVSTIQLARLVNAYIQAQKLPVKLVHQQEISKLENASLVSGPKRPQPWWGVVREFIESGEIDTLLAAIHGPTPDDSSGVVVDFWQAKAERESVVRTPDGRVVGKIVWGEND